MKTSKSKKRYKLRFDAIRSVFRRFTPHLRKRRRTILAAFACMIGATLVEVARPWPIKIVFDGILMPQDNPGQVINWLNGIASGESALLTMIIGAILLIAILGGLFGFGQSYLLASVGQKVVADIRAQLYAHVQRLSQSFHDERSTGDLLSRLTEDVRMMRDLLVSSAVFLIARSLVVILTVFIMALMDWKLTLVALAVLPLLALTTVKFGTKIKGAARRQRRKESKIAQVMAERISSIKVVQAYAREAHEDQQFAKQNNSSARAGLVATKLEANMDRVVQILLAFGTGLVVWYGVHRVRADALTPGDLLVFIAYLASLYKPVRRMASLTGRVSKATVCGERILAILNTEPDIADAPDAVEAPRFNGQIDIVDVDFAYLRGAPVLKQANLSIKPRETIAFMSESGSGKTTLGNLLLRFYDPQSGAILFDGQDIRSFTVTSLRNQIAVVLQESILFNSSIAENISYGKLDASSEQLEAAARLANAHDFIVQMPDGYDTIIGERGSTLSGGQRQRVAIARAIVRDAPILILDEPFAGLDAENEASVREALHNLLKDRTALIITHDMATACLADRIMTLRDGKMQELQADNTAPPSRKLLAQ